MKHSDILNCDVYHDAYCIVKQQYPTLYKIHFVQK